MPSQETNSYLNWSVPVAAVLSALIFGILGYYFGVKGTPTAPGAGGLPSVIKDTIAYLPHILLLFGVIADMLTYEGVYSIASLIGFLSIFINFVFGYFWSGVMDVFSSLGKITTGNNAPVPGELDLRGGGRPGEFSGNYDGCEVQGFGKIRNPYAPQTLVVTATLFFYFLLDSISNRGWVNSTATIILFFVLYGAQTFVVGDCAIPNDPNISKYIKSLIAAIEGLFIGGISYSVVQSYYPNRLPSSVVSPFPRKAKSDLKPGTSGGSFIDESGNPYVCLSSGQCYPDMSTQESRTAFAKIAGENLGTGAPPAADCKGT